ncbi:MAG: chemotaxis protein CheW [Hahellaceae bacterium]|jgi:purine-binding chemotaxis protein CheW|nr:chemotaxis protein CheW [Hahellaceae bacterium]
MAGDTKSVSKGLEQEMLSYLDELLRVPVTPAVQETHVAKPDNLPASKSSKEVPEAGKPESNGVAGKTTRPLPSASELELPMSLARQRMMAREKTRQPTVADIPTAPPRPLMPKVLMSGPELKLAPEPEAPKPPPPTAAKVRPPPVQAAPKVVSPQPELTEPMVKVAAPQPAAPQPAAPEPVAVAPKSAEPSEPPRQILGEWIDGHPPWATGRFECLLFSVGGLKLSVPLVLLGGVYPVKVDDLTPIFGMPNWFMGLFKHGETTIKVVDSARWIMPEKYPENFPQQVRYVIRLHDSEWALACNSIADAFTLQASEVRWRTEHAKRPWLAGTVVQKMCAILDVDQFNTLLENAHPRRK